MSRPIMTAAELREHQQGQHGRNYAESDDGWSDMEVEEKRGWHAVAGWGRDGWDLGDWPYVAIYHRTRPAGRFQLMQIVEGDRTVYEFGSTEDLDAATDYLFLWYLAGRGYDWAPLTWDQRERLDDGDLQVDDKWRGPYRPRVEPVMPVMPS